MRIGLIGPKESVTSLKKISDNSQILAEIVPLLYTNFKESIDIINKEEKNFDALLFTGQTPYRYAINFLTPRITWEYIHRNSLSILYALLKASTLFKIKNFKLSMDGFDAFILQTLQRDIGFEDFYVDFQNRTFDILDEEYFSQVTQYHVKNYASANANLCMTGVQNVYDYLTERNIPAIKVNPSPEIYLRKLELLCLKHKFSKNKENSPAVIVLNVKFSEEYSFYYQSELYNIKMTSKVAEAVYYFAQRIGAAVFQINSKKYYIVTNKNDISIETEQFQHLNLLRSILGNDFISSASIGIGIGANSIDAKLRADRSENHAQKDGRFSCYAMDETDYLIGPITINSDNGKTKLDAELLMISERSGVGIKSLQKIIQAIEQYNIKSITPFELAHYCQMSLRGMNRIIEKLEENGYVDIVGKKPADGAGRPSRVVKILLTKK